MNAKKCQEWIDNKNINPETGRKIKKDGPVYKKLEKECRDQINSYECDKWRNNTLRNPKTGRLIKYKGPTFEKLAKKCKKTSTPDVHIFKPFADVHTTDASGSSDYLDEDSSRTDYAHINPEYDESSSSYIPKPSTDDNFSRSYIPKPSTDHESKTLKSIQFNKNYLEKFLQERQFLRPKIRLEISKLQVEVWDMCVSKPHSKFRDELTNVQNIGRGTFGVVYRAKFKNFDIVIKEAYIKPKELKKLNERKSGNFSKPSYSKEYNISLLLNDLLQTKMSPNFLFVYDLVMCNGCLIDGERGKCFNTIMEPADGDLYILRTQSFEQYESILYQMLLGVTAMHKKYGIYHRDIKLRNVLYKSIPPGGYFKYIVDDYTFYVKNNGILIFISDFGVSHVLSPTFSDEYYGTRNVHVNSKGLLEPVTCSKAPKIKWNKKLFGTFNYITKNFKDKCNINIDLYDMQKFPPLEFFFDIQDTLRMFAGGKRTVQPSYHHGLDISPDLKKTLEMNILEYFPYNKHSAKYLFAQEMLANIYSSPTTPYPEQIIDTFTI